jgi:hypothetical protein
VAGLTDARRELLLEAVAGQGRYPGLDGGARAGFGHDHYFADRPPAFYPEACAHAARALVALGRRDSALLALDSLLGSQVPGGGWGLPWTWGRFTAEKVGFASTTAVAVHAFLDAGLDPPEEALDAVSFNPHAYAFQHGVVHLESGVWNGVAQVYGALCRAGRAPRRLPEHLRELRHWTWHGMVAYSTEKPHWFEQHQCMVAEGLMQVGASLPTRRPWCAPAHPPSVSVWDAREAEAIAREASCAGEAARLAEEILVASREHLLTEEGRGRVAVARPDDMYSGYLALFAWCYAEHGQLQFADAIEETLWDGYWTDDYGFTTQRGGALPSARMNAWVCSCLARRRRS